MILQGGRKQDGLAVNGDAGHSSIQVPANKPAMGTTLMKVTGMSHPSFFYPPLSRAWHEGVPSFLAGEGRWRCDCYDDRYSDPKNAWNEE